MSKQNYFNGLSFNSAGDSEINVADYSRKLYLHIQLGRKMWVTQRAWENLSSLTPKTETLLPTQKYFYKSV
jgi:hypothetical protein